MIRYNRFRYLFHTYKVSQLRELHDLRDLHELPVNSYLVNLDNFQNFGGGHINYGPALDNPIINMNNWKLLVSNVNAPVEGVAPIVSNRMILTNAGLNTQFMTYRTEMQPRVMYFPTINDLPTRTNAQRVLNFNSLFRARVTGIRRKPRFFNMLYASIINTMMKDQDGVYYIHIPLENLIFDRKDFAKVFRQYDRIATKYPECSSYLFLAHLYSILMKSITLPPRGISIEEDEEDKKAEESLLVEPSDEFDVSSEEFMTNIFNYVMSDPACATEALNMKDTENPYKLSVFEYLPPRMFEHVNFILTCGGQFVIYNLRDLKELNGRSGAGLIRIIRHINLLAACGQPGQMRLEEPPMVAEDVVDVDDTGTKANQPEFVVPMTKEEKQASFLQDLDELDDYVKIIETKIDQTKQQPLTTAQKEHIAVISHTYKNLTINGKSFAQVLSEVPDVNIETPVVETPTSKEGAVSATVTASTTAELDNSYVQKTMDKDIAAIVTSFNKQGMFLVDFKEETSVDDLNSTVTYTAKYEDIDHKKHVMRFTIPKVDKFGRYKDNGSYKSINKQRVSNPITKASPTRVTLNSNYNKLLVERNGNAAHSFWNWFEKALAKGDELGFKTMRVHGSCSYPTQALPFELTEIGGKLTRLNFQNGNMIFDIVNREAEMPDEFKESILKDEKDYGIWFGHRENNQFFITVTGQVAVRDAKTGQETFYGAFIDFIEWLMNVKLTPMVEYTDLEVVGRRVPLIHALGYRYGLTNMLKYTGCDYEVYDVNTRIEKRTSDIIIKFSDKKLVISRTPRNNALLFGGLSIYDFSDVSLEDMDDKDIYYEMLTQKKVSNNLIKGIDSMFDMFIDPSTRDVLREMKEPTDIRDLLLRANTLLTTSEHKPAASAANFRFRGVEQITGIVYNEMAKAFSNFKNKSSGGATKFSISAYQVKQRIAKEQLVENVALLNPLADIKQYSKFSNAGSGGRNSETFMIADRQFTKDQIGVVSEATVDNGKTGMNASLPFNPIIVNDRGMCVEGMDVNKLEPENILSVTSLLYPGVTHDDSKRANFVNIQASHYVPIKESDVSRVRTGFEEVIAQRCCEPCFAYAAQEDGVVESLDEKSKTIVVRYKSGERICLNYGDQYTNNAGAYVNQAVVVNNFKNGDKVRKGDIITYNHEFFQADPYSKQVRWKIGILAKVALMDNGGTIEDASVLTQPLCDRMVYNPVHLKEIVITTDTNVHAFADVGTHVNNTDPLLIFDQSAIDFGENDDPELISLLSDLNKQAPKAGHTGTVVKIEALYKSQISEMSTSLQKIVKHVTQLKNAKAAAATGCSNSDSFQKSSPLTATTKVGTVDLTKDTVILRFYIKQNMGMNPGDKLFFDSSLKSVCSTVYPESIKTEDGTVVDAMTSCRGVLARLITSPFISGLGNSVLEKLEQDILNIWNGKEVIDQNA